MLQLTLDMFLQVEVVENGNMKSNNYTFEIKLIMFKYSQYIQILNSKTEETRERELLPQED